MENKSLRVVSLNHNEISRIENIDDMWIEELYISQNKLHKITGLSKLLVLRTLDLSKNQIVKLRGLETIESLRFLTLALNSIEKVL